VPSEAGDACPSHAQHTRSRGILPRVARTRKRFWAWTLTLTTALLAVVWVGSMRFYPSFSGRQRGAGLCYGGICISASVGHVLVDNEGFGWYDSGKWSAIWWFSYEAKQSSPLNSLYEWQIPLWPFVLLTGVPGVWMLVKTRKHANPNACPACGYDRTGLPQTSTGPAPCPECGKN